MTLLFLCLYALIVSEGDVGRALLFSHLALADSRIDIVFLLTSVVIAPLIENLAILALAALAGKFAPQRFNLITLGMGGLIIGLVVHGIAFANFGRAVAFSLLSLLFAKKRRLSLGARYVDSVAAHALWNGISISLILLSKMVSG